MAATSPPRCDEVKLGGQQIQNSGGGTQVEEFDYIVVGGGSAGCAVTSRLSEDPRITVCMLEAGGAGNNWVVKAPIGIAIMVPSKTNNWAFETVPQAGLNGRKGYQPRGKALGGSSAINAMVYVRGHRSDYDGWAALGNTGWGYSDVLPYFKKSENNEVVQDAFHGKGGPLNVANIRTSNPFQEYFLEAGRQLQLPVTSDFNGADQMGLGIYQVTQKNGERWSAARAYIEPNLSRPNLKIITGALARRILFDGKRAIGIEFGRGGKQESVRARREVILSSGAFQSPQLLMLSGIGNAPDLKSVGIEVVHYAPGVGRNLQDHIDFAFTYRSRNLDNFGVSLAGFRRLWREIGRYRRDGLGMITSNVAECGGFLKTDPNLQVPDIQLHFSVATADNHGRTRHLGHGFGCHVCLLRPKSRGTVALNSADPMDPPRIDPKFYDHPDDLEVMVKAFKITRRIMNAEPLAKWRTAEMYSERVQSDDEIRTILRDRSDTVYHPVGTARMGTDEMAVVDPQLKVVGVERLRVVDASIMPTLIGGNTNAPSIMIGEKAADMIRAAH
jgi:choline dehydrogenase-like flavoprotein